MQEKKPNFIVIGAMKAATTSLYTYLKQHPDIFMTDIKEPMFFNNFKQNNQYVIKGRKASYIRSWEEYLKLFVDVQHESSIGEASPAYIYNKKCASLIKEYLPNTKIIAILRHPVDRAYSNFLHARRDDREDVSNFKQAFLLENERISKNWSPLYHYKSKGYYYAQLERYYKLFERDKMKVIIYEDFISSPLESIKKIFQFLEIDDSFTPNISRKSNVSGVPKGYLGWIVKKLRYYRLMPKISIIRHFPNFINDFLFSSVYDKSDPLDANLRRDLTQKYYTQDITKLEKLIDQDLSNWLR